MSPKKSDPGCNWLSYDRDSGQCYTSPSCQLDPSKDNFLAAQVACGRRPEDTQVLVVGGRTLVTVEGAGTVAERPLAAAQVARLDVFLGDYQEELTPDGCPAALPDFPFRVEMQTGALINGKARLCGGFVRTEIPYERGARDDCWEYDPAVGGWAEVEPLLAARWSHKSSVVGADRWLVTGGRGANGSDLSSTEVWVAEAGGFVRGPELPAARRDHCQVTLDGQRVLVAGGSCLDPSCHAWDLSAYAVDLSSGDPGEYAGRPWVRLPDLAGGVAGSRFQPACGLVRGLGGAGAGPAVVVLSAGTSEVLYLDDVDSGWKPGPSVSILLDGAYSVQLRDTFAAAGGLGLDGTVLDSLTLLDPVAGVFRTVGGALGTAADDAAAVSVPPSALGC